MAAPIHQDTAREYEMSGEHDESSLLIMQKHCGPHLHTSPAAQIYPTNFCLSSSQLQ